MADLDHRQRPTHLSYSFHQILSKTRFSVEDEQKTHDGNDCCAKRLPIGIQLAHGPPKTIHQIFMTVELSWLTMSSNSVVFHNQPLGPLDCIIDSFATDW